MQNLVAVCHNISMSTVLFFLGGGAGARFWDRGCIWPFENTLSTHVLPCQIWSF